MASANDVAAYILRTRGPMSAMKLQKLVYYSQAWHLVWEEKPLFSEEIQAWANGPVVYDLYKQHKGSFTVEAWPSGRPANLTDDEMLTIDAVMRTYGQYSAHQLSELTHRELPWQQAREGLPEGSRSAADITPASMHEYYHGLSSTDA